MYHVYLNQAAGAYLFLCFLNFLSLKFQTIKHFVACSCEAYKLKLNTQLSNVLKISTHCFLFLQNAYKCSCSTRTYVVEVVPEHLYMSRLMTNPPTLLCAQPRLRSVWASAQSDQSLLCVQWLATS